MGSEPAPTDVCYVRTIERDLLFGLRYQTLPFLDMWFPAKGFTTEKVLLNIPFSKTPYDPLFICRHMPQHAMIMSKTEIAVLNTFKAFFHESVEMNTFNFSY